MRKTYTFRTSKPYALKPGFPTIWETTSRNVRESLARYGEVCETLAEKAKAGDKDAAKLIAQEIVKPFKSPAVAHQKTGVPESIQRAYDSLGVVKIQREKELRNQENQQLESKKPPESLSNMGVHGGEVLNRKYGLYANCDAGL